MIVTFLALLEMIRLKLMRVFQPGGVGAIRIYKRARPTDAPHPIHDPEDEYNAHQQAAERRAAAVADAPPIPSRIRPDAGARAAEPMPTSAERRGRGRMSDEMPDDPIVPEPPTRRAGAGRFRPRRRTATAPHDRGASTSRPAEATTARAWTWRSSKAIVEALMFASPEPLTPKMLIQAAGRRAEGGRAGGPRRAAGATTTDRAGCTWPRSPAATRSPRGPSCTSGCGGCSTSARAEAVGGRARDAGGDRLQAADHRRRDRRDSRRQHVGRALDAARAAPDQDRRPQERRRPAVPLRHDQGVPDPLRPEGSRPTCRRSRTWRRRSASSRRRCSWRSRCTDEMLPLEEDDVPGGSPGAEEH